MVEKSNRLDDTAAMPSGRPLRRAAGLNGYQSPGLDWIEFGWIVADARICDWTTWANDLHRSRSTL